MTISRLRTLALAAIAVSSAAIAVPAQAGEQIPQQKIHYRIEAYQIPAGTNPDVSNPSAVHDAFTKNELLAVDTGKAISQPTLLSSKEGERQPFLTGSTSPYVHSVSRVSLEDGNVETGVETSTAIDGWRGSVTTEHISGSAVSFQLSAEFGALKELVKLASLSVPGIPPQDLMAPLYRAGSTDNLTQEIKVRIAQPTVVHFGKSHVLIVTATLS